jgi:hypothetical protein
MHQYKTVAQMLLILSIFNLVLAAPVVREIRDAHGDGAVPVVGRNMADERRQSTLDGPTPSDSSPPSLDGSTPLHSSPLLPDESLPSHSSPPLPGGSTAPDASDGEAPLHGRPTPPGGPASLAVSSPPGGTAALPDVPATRMDLHGMLAAVFPSRNVLLQRFGTLLDKSVIGGIVFAIAGGSILYSKLSNPSRRTIDPDWYVSNPPLLNALNHKRSDL